MSVDTAREAKLSSVSVEHYTPAAIVEAARFTLGRIALDPASCASANEIVRAERYFTEADDGLAQPWTGPVFLNPPGGVTDRKYAGCKSRSQAVLWWAKLCNEWRRPDQWSAVFVGFSLEILQAAQSYVGPQPLDFPICIPERRIKFETEGPLRDGVRVPGDQPTHGNVIVCVTDERDVARRFAAAFRPFGRVWGVS